ncbi:MAG: ATP-binding cassette domain-containing protein, partial [Rhodocyclaceae bacterium]|nr:ATP-binding cassette domain-containing protein [Rhodocyclaceae bacterium]
MTDDLPLLRLDNLQFRWRPDRPCLDIAHFAIAAGERVFLHGESGSGKSTLLGLLGGVLSAQRGSVRLLGEDLACLPSSRRDQLRADHIG